MAAERPSRGISISDWPASPFEGATADRRSPRAVRAASLLITRLKSGEMPPGEKKVPAEEINKIAAWIDGGLATEREEPESLPPGIDITPAERAYWFYQPLDRPAPPTIEQAERVRTPIDAFVARASCANRDSTSPADAATDGRCWCGRRSTSPALPPTPRRTRRVRGRHRPPPRTSKPLDTAARVAPLRRALGAALARRRRLRRLGRLHGGQDSPRGRIAYKYRDYVIRAFNADKPFDQFITEQLAGDELVAATARRISRPSRPRLLTATGFLRMARRRHGTAAASTRTRPATRSWPTRSRSSATSLLGLTVGCAQCHDHRYDPIPQTDYYRLRAVFEPAYDWKNWRTPDQRLVSLYTDADREKAAEIDAEANKLQELHRQEPTSTWPKRSRGTSQVSGRPARPLRDGLRRPPRSDRPSSRRSCSMPTPA